MRTGAVTALGARHLAPRGARVLGHIGARGTAYWNVRLLARVLGGLEEIRVHSRRPESRDAFAARLEADLGRPVTVTDDWESCVRGADVVVEASRLEAPEPLLRTEWIAPGALVVPYGTMSAVELSLTSIMDKVVVDDWGQAGAGPFGALRRARRRGPRHRREPARRARPDRRRAAAGPRVRGRDDPLLAPRAVDDRRRAGPRAAREGRAARRRADGCATAEPRAAQCGPLPLRRRWGSSSIEKDWNGPSSSLGVVLAQHERHVVVGDLGVEELVVQQLGRLGVEVDGRAGLLDVASSGLGLADERQLELDALGVVLARGDAQAAGIGDDDWSTSVRTTSAAVGVSVSTAAHLLGEEDATRSTPQRFSRHDARPRFQPQACHTRAPGGAGDAQDRHPT